MSSLFSALGLLSIRVFLALCADLTPCGARAVLGDPGEATVGSAA